MGSGTLRALSLSVSSRCAEGSIRTGILYVGKPLQLCDNRYCCHTRCEPCHSTMLGIEVCFMLWGELCQRDGEGEGGVCEAMMAENRYRCNRWRLLFVSST